MGMGAAGLIPKDGQLQRGIKADSANGSNRGEIWLLSRERSMFWGTWAFLGRCHRKSEGSPLQWYVVCQVAGSCTSYPWAYGFIIPFHYDIKLLVLFCLRMYYILSAMAIIDEGCFYTHAYWLYHYTFDLFRRMGISVLTTPVQASCCHIQCTIAFFLC